MKTLVRLLSRTVPLFLGVPCVACPAAPSPDRLELRREDAKRPIVSQRHSPSPDGQRRVVLLDVARETVVLLFDRPDREEPAWRHSFLSKDGEHGWRISQLHWSRDSRWVALRLVNSGGHQPWYEPIRVVDAKTGEILDPSENLGPSLVPVCEPRGSVSWQPGGSLRFRVLDLRSNRESWSVFRPMR